MNDQLERRARQYAKRHGTASNVRFNADEHLPRADASAYELEAFHQRMTQGPCGFDPTSIL